MNLYHKNLEFIKKNNIELYNVVNEEPIFDDKVERIEEYSNYVIEFNGARCFAHSIYDINNELKMTFCKADLDSEIIVLFGLGCGYALKYILENYKKLERIIIIEPSLNMFKEFLKNSDIYESFRKFKSMTLIINQKIEMASLSVATKVFNNDKVSFVYNLSYRTLFEEYYNDMMNETLKIIQLKRGNIVISDYAVFHWLTNSIRNLKHNDFPIEKINSIFKDKPVIIVSAGPSLNKNMNLLKEIKDKAIIIAVGTAIKILDSNGIKPHFRAAYDGTPAEERIFDNLIDQSIPLIYGNKFYNEILPKYKGLKYSMVLSNDFFAKYIYEKSEIDYINIAIGASIANVTVNLLCESGCSKVILLGQDLCYTDGSLYAKGSNKNENIIDFSDYIKIKDIYDNDVYTHHVFLNMKYGLEYSTRKYSKIEFINATEGGLNIEGTKIKTLKQAIEEDLKENIDFSLMEELNNTCKENELEEHRNKIDTMIDEIDKEIEIILKINKERLEYLTKLRKNLGKNLSNNRLLGDLKYIEKFEKELKEFGYYKEVIALELEEKLNTLQLSFGYDGNDVREEIKSVEKILSGICIDVQNYAMCTKELIDEYKNKQ